MVLWYASANRDAAVFDDPYRFDVARTPNDHLGFGGPGPALLPRRPPGPAGDHGDVPRAVPPAARHPGRRASPMRLRSNFINGIKHLPATWTPAAAVKRPLAGPRGSPSPWLVAVGGLAACGGGDDGDEPTARRRARRRGHRRRRGDPRRRRTSTPQATVDYDRAPAGGRRPRPGLGAVRLLRRSRSPTSTSSTPSSTARCGSPTRTTSPEATSPCSASSSPTTSDDVVATPYPGPRRGRGGGRHGLGPPAHASTSVDDPRLERVHRAVPELDTAPEASASARRSGGPGRLTRRVARSTTVVGPALGGGPVADHLEAVVERHAVPGEQEQVAGRAPRRRRRPWRGRARW